MLLDLPLEVRLMIYRMLLPPEIRIRRIQRDYGSFCRALVKFDPLEATKATRILHVSRQIRQEVVPVMSSRIRYMIPLRVSDIGATIELTFDWLRRFGPPVTDSLRKVTISYLRSSDHNTRSLFHAMAKLPRTSLRFNTRLRTLQQIDSRERMEIHDVRGFSHVSFVNWCPTTGFNFCERHSQQPLEGWKVWEDLDQRFQQATKKFMSPNLDLWGQPLPQHLPSHGTTSMEIRWYGESLCDEINCVSGVLEKDSGQWTPGKWSVFILDEVAEKSAK